MNLNELMTGALKVVRQTDWSTWPIPFGDSWLATRVFANQPPLTNGIFAAYVSYCSWIWNRQLSPFEQQRARDELLKIWADETIDFSVENSRSLEILSFVWMLNGLQGVTPQHQEALRRQIGTQLQDGAFPGIDVDVPGIDFAKRALGPSVPPSTLRSPEVTGVALDGLYEAMTVGLKLDIFGPPGTGTWGSQLEFYAFFPDGQFIHFRSLQEAGEYRRDPKTHRGPRGTYEVSKGQIKLYDQRNGETKTSVFTSSADLENLEFEGKAFKRIDATAGLEG